MNQIRKFLVPGNNNQSNSKVSRAHLARRGIFSASVEALSVGTFDWSVPATELQQVDAW